MGVQDTLPEAIDVAGRVAFWPENSEEIELYVDGQRMDAPRR